MQRDVTCSDIGTDPLMKLSLCCSCLKIKMALFLHMLVIGISSNRMKTKSSFLKAFLTWAYRKNNGSGHFGKMVWLRASRCLNVVITEGLNRTMLVTSERWGFFLLVCGWISFRSVESLGAQVPAMG